MFVMAAALALFGTVMVYSASAMISMRETAADPDGPTRYLYVSKQLVFTLVGIILMLVISRIDYHIYENRFLVFAALTVTVVLLCAVFAFPAINGARRWIRVPGLSFQPSEVAKLALPLFLAWFLTRREDSVGDLVKTVAPTLAVVGLLCALVVLEPDLGTTAVLCAIFVAVYLSAGAKMLHVATVVGLILSGLGLALVVAPWRVARLVAFLEPCSEENRMGAGYQVCQSLMGIGSGGVLGGGFAKGFQKLFYLPYPYSDFIFATIGEELGLIGSLAVLVAFAILLWRGARAALTAPDRFGTLLGIGIITGITVQALFNISVVVSIVPAKGIPLPLLSYGGSSVVLTLVAVGVLLSISRYSGTKAVTLGSSSAPAVSGRPRSKARKRVSV